MKLENRSSGILLHITSIPSDHGIGDLGPCSHRFVDLLSGIKQRYWSILPLGPTSIAYGNSPYQTQSAFAGNTLLISPESLVKNDLLPKEHASTYLSPPLDRVDYCKVTIKKNAMIRRTYDSFKKSRSSSAYNVEFEAFCHERSDWLEDYAVFSVLSRKSRKPWYLWPSQLRDREAQSLARKKQHLKDLVDREKFAQLLFFAQWKALKAHCAKKNVQIFGDLPFYVGFDSADVWAHPELFKLDAKKKPRFVAGVPPDYFSKNGQLWGNPVYRWRHLEETCFAWWTKRISNCLKMVDILRLDHFRGFFSYWQVPAPARTAKNGKWMKAPSENLFRVLKRHFPNLPFVAEDLGMITKDVSDALLQLGIAGMRILIFAFDGTKDNPHLPSNHRKNSVVLTGTHDTNTVRGWFSEETDRKQRQRVFRCLGHTLSERTVNREFIKLALTSKASLAITPIQDILGLGSEARMNNPARHLHNWEWRATARQLSNEKFRQFGVMTEAFRR